ncbi:MAG: hypothetical protein JNM56_22045 [Planctomycetia bacterium]|nr:hypothetical protein [Planctomycetia bacterium]
MSATALCPTCRTPIEIADEAPGAPLTCPGCGTLATPAESVPTAPSFRVVAVSEERDIPLPPCPSRPVAAPSPDDTRQLADPWGLTGFVTRLAALGAVCLAALAGMLLWKGSSLVMIALYAVGLLVVVSVANLLLRRSQEPTLRVVGAIILVGFAAIGLLSLLTAAFLFLVSCLVNL